MSGRLVARVAFALACGSVAVGSGAASGAQEGAQGGPPASGSCVDDAQGDSVAGSAPAPFAVGLRRVCAWREADGRLTLYVEQEDGGVLGVVRKHRPDQPEDSEGHSVREYRDRCERCGLDEGRERSLRNA